MSIPTLPISIVIPTIGRPELLRQLLLSIAACSPAADEVVVIDQSTDDSVARVVAQFQSLNVRRVACKGRGEALARNAGLRAARHRTLLWTDDDCTVSTDWVGVAWEQVQDEPDGCVSGKVLAAGDPLATPSTCDAPSPRVYTGTVSCSALHPPNMVLNRDVAIALGGFDENLPVAVDCDFCYRWLRAGNALRYEPALVVWHHDWRSAKDLEQLYVAYARGQGLFYGKHLRNRDLTVLRFIGRDLYQYARSLAVALLRGRPVWSDWRRGILKGLPAGLREGWKLYAP